MKLISLRLQGYRQFLEPTPLEFPDGLIGICGPNGAGKSKLVEAIGYALYGPDFYVLPKGDKAVNVPSTSVPGTKHQVEFTFELRGQRFKIFRSNNKVFVSLDGSIDPLATGSKEVGRKISNLLNLTSAGYTSTFVARQNQIAGLQGLDKSLRKQLVNKLLGISLIEKAIAEGQLELQNRTKIHSIQSMTIGKTEADELAELEKCISSLTEIEVEHSEAICHFELSEREYNGALEVWNDLQKKIDEISSIKKQLITLAESKTTFNSFRQSALDRIEQANNATLRLGEIQEILAIRPALEKRICYRTHLNSLWSSGIKAAGKSISMFKKCSSRFKPKLNKLKSTRSVRWMTLCQPSTIATVPR